MSPTRIESPRVHWGIYLWAVLGVTLLVVRGLYAVGMAAWEAVSGPLSPWQVAALWVWVVTNLYLEGYRGFQLRFVPRVVSRAYLLARGEHSGKMAIALAPLFAMGFFHAKRSAQRAAWILTGVVAVLVIAMRHLSQPLRGIIDAGVVAGLAYGTLSLLAAAYSTAVNRRPPADPEWPETTSIPAPSLGAPDPAASETG